MVDVRSGFDLDRNTCEQSGLEPVNYYPFIVNLNQELLVNLNDQANHKRGLEIEN